MKLKLVIPLKPLSYNQYYRNTRSGKRVKTGAGLAYEEELEYLLSCRESSLLSFGKEFDPSKSIVKLDIEIFNPYFFRKADGYLNPKSGDIDNSVKVLQDKIFKYANIDDSAVKKLTVTDWPSDRPGMIITLDFKGFPTERVFPIELI